MSFPDWQTLAIIVLATGRLQAMWFEEIFRLPRNWMLRRPNQWVKYLAQCPLCISVWAAAGLTLASLHPVGRFGVTVLAVSGAVVLVNQLMNRPQASMAIAQELRNLNGTMQNMAVEK